MDKSEIRWRIDLDTCRPIRYAVYGFFGSLVLLITSVLFGFVGAVLVGTYQLHTVDVFFAALILLIVGPIAVWRLRAIRERVPESTPSVIPFVGDPINYPDQPIEERYQNVLSDRNMFMILIGFGILGIVAFLLHQWLPFAIVASLWTYLAAVSFVTGWGRIDRDQQVFEYHNRRISLEEILTYRSIRIGDVIIGWITYRSGASATRVRSLVSFSVPAFEAFETMVARHDATAPSVDRGDLLVSTVALVIGLPLAGLAIGFLMISEIPLLIRYYVSSMIALFGVLFLWVSGTYGSPILRQYIRER